MWHAAGRKYTPIFVICGGEVECIQYEIQVRTNIGLIIIGPC